MSGTASLSGNAYVPMRLKDTGGTAAQIRVFQEVRCEHLETVCIRCVEQWMTDYDVFFQRTGGGRRLAAEMVAHGMEVGEL